MGAAQRCAGFCERRWCCTAPACNAQTRAAQAAPDIPAAARVRGLQVRNASWLAACGCAARASGRHTPMLRAARSQWAAPRRARAPGMPPTARARSLLARNASWLAAALPRSTRERAAHASLCCALRAHNGLRRAARAHRVRLQQRARSACAAATPRSERREPSQDKQVHRALHLSGMTRCGAANTPAQLPAVAVQHVNTRRRGEALFMQQLEASRLPAMFVRTNFGHSAAALVCYRVGPLARNSTHKKLASVRRAAPERFFKKESVPRGACGSGTVITAVAAAQRLLSA